MRSAGSSIVFRWLASATTGYCSEYFYHAPRQKSADDRTHCYAQKWLIQVELPYLFHRLTSLPQ